MDPAPVTSIQGGTVCLHSRGAPSAPKLPSAHCCRLWPQSGIRPFQTVQYDQGSLHTYGGDAHVRAGYLRTAGATLTTQYHLGTQMAGDPTA